MEVVNIPLVNGDFESGTNVGWSEHSSHGAGIILQVGELPYDLPPHSGTWAAWLGGINDELSYVQQDITVSGRPATLNYWHWIESLDECNSDAAYILVSGVQVTAYDLCTESTTEGWVERRIDLSDYSGQTITLRIEVETDDEYSSSLFVDDVSLNDEDADLFLPLIVR
jgi:hypothetical protein